MAPEIINNSYYGISVDIWALGVLFYFMLFAEYPFKGKPFIIQAMIWRRKLTEDALHFSAYPIPWVKKKNLKMWMLMCKIFSKKYSSLTVKKEWPLPILPNTHFLYNMLKSSRPTLIFTTNFKKRETISGINWSTKNTGWTTRWSLKTNQERHFWKRKISVASTNTCKGNLRKLSFKSIKFTTWENVLTSSLIHTHLI